MPDALSAGPQDRDAEFGDDLRRITTHATIAGTMRADGVAELIRAVSEQVDPRAQIVTLTDPKTGIEVLATVDGNSVRAIDPAVFDGARDNPLYRRGTATMTSLDSFIAHVGRFGDNDTVVFANDDRSAPKLTAVLDYHRTDYQIDSGARPGDDMQHGEYRHGKHRTAFAFPLSDEWKAWTKAAGQELSMIEFASFLEDRIIDVTGLEAAGELSPQMANLVTLAGGPSAVATQASLIEVATGLKVNESAVVEEAQTLSTGEGHIRFTVDHTTKNGRGDTIRVPSLFVIAIPVLRNGPPYVLMARFRYRKTPAGLVFWFDLVRSDLVFDHAFKEAVERVEAETPATVLYGSPEA